MCLAMSPDSRFIASASKARDAGTAQVLLWGRPLTTTAPGMQLLSRLPGHESTVVCLEFSPNNRFVCTVYGCSLCVVVNLLISFVFTL